MMKDIAFAPFLLVTILYLKFACRYIVSIEILSLKENMNLGQTGNMVALTLPALDDYI